MGDQSAMHCDAHRIYRCTVCEKVVEQARLLGLSASREAKLLARVAELEAENQRLREAANRVLYALLPGKVVHMGHEHVRYSATYSVVGWNPILSLAALLGGGEK